MIRDLDKPNFRSTKLPERDLGENTKQHMGYRSVKKVQTGQKVFNKVLFHELFHEVLEWPFKNIVLGEQFDVLFVNNEVKPKLYLETKKPGKGLVNVNHFKDRARFYGTLRYAIITDGIVWARFEVNEGKLVNQMLVNTKKAVKEWNSFCIPRVRKRGSKNILLSK